MNADKVLVALSELAVFYGGRVVVALLVLLVGWIAAGWVGRLARNALARARIDETLSRFLTKLASWSVMLLVFLACLSLFGVETTSFAAVIGSVGIAIGLAFQGTLSNFAAGIMLVMFRPFKVGDVIKVAGQLGTVDAIELFTTTLDSPDNRRFIVPNGQVFGSLIENMSHHALRRADVDLGVSYAANIDSTRAALTRAVQNVSQGLAQPAPEIVLTDLGSSAVNWSVRMWTRTVDFQNARQAMIRAVKVALDEAGIEIPFPQIAVHLRKEE